MNRIAIANDISRRFCEGKISLEEAFYKELQQIETKQYRRAIYNIATVCICGGFAPLFNGGWLEVAGASAAGAVLALIVTIGKKLKIQGFIQDVLSSFGLALMAIFFEEAVSGYEYGYGNHQWYYATCSGVAITTAIRDTLQGDYLSGCARILEAFLCAVSVALGVALAMAATGIMGTGGVVL